MRFDIIEVYRQAFGYKGIPFIGLNTTPIVPLVANSQVIETVSNPWSDGRFKTSSIFGTPYFMPCKLDGYQLPNEPIIQLNRTKIIVKTQIDGKEGTFKEKYSDGDYIVTIKGVCVNENNNDDYPEDQVRELRRIFEQPFSVSVVSRITTLFGIEKLAINKIDLPAIEGAPGMQPYLFECESDMFTNLEILEGTI